MPPELPGDWRDRVTAMVAGKAPLDGGMFAGGPVLTPIRQIGVYRDQYRLRLYDALDEELVGLGHLLGDDAEAVLWAYLEAHPSRTWTLNRVADRLEGWLAETGAPIEQVEMARLDRAVQHGFEAADGTPIDPTALAALPALELQPHVTLLKLTTNAHAIRSAVLAEDEPPALETGLAVHLVLYRKHTRMRHWELTPGAWTVLAGIRDGRALMPIFEDLVATGLLTPEQLGQAAQTWFRDFAAYNLVQIAQP